MITHTLMMVSRGLCLCALTPSAGETGDQDLMQSVVGQTWNRVPPCLQRRVVYLFCSRQQHKKLPYVLNLSSSSTSLCQVLELGGVCKVGRGHLGRRSGLRHIGEALIWCARRAAAADSPSRDSAVFVLRVCKLAVIRLLSNDVGELIRAVLMGALISL